MLAEGSDANIGPMFITMASNHLDQCWKTYGGPMQSPTLDQCFTNAVWLGGQGASGTRHPILQTKHKHTYELHKICQSSQFIFEKIIKIVATRFYLLKLKCTKFDFGWGFAPDFAGRSSQRSPDPPPVF